MFSSALRRPLFPFIGGSQAAENTRLSSRVQSPSCRTWILRKSSPGAEVIEKGCLKRVRVFEIEWSAMHTYSTNKLYINILDSVKAIFFCSNCSLFTIKRHVPFKWWNSWTLNKHILPALVTECRWLRHLQCQNITRIYGHLQSKCMCQRTRHGNRTQISNFMWVDLQYPDRVTARPEEPQSPLPYI